MLPIFIVSCFSRSHLTNCIVCLSESFNKQLSTRCMCPKECDISRYRGSISYATSSKNNEILSDVSADFLFRTGKHLNESIDTKEWLLPDKHKANVDEFELLYRAIGFSSGIYLSRLQYETDHLRLKMFSLRESCNFIIERGLQVMQNIFRDHFVAIWENMNFYDCMSRSFELYRIITYSLHSNDHKSWRAAVRLRLEENIIASETTLHNLDRVHDAYCNVAPLLNYTTTPKGSYHAFYLSEELLRQSSKINETYARVRHYIISYIENIGGLFHILLADGNKGGSTLKYFNYSNGFWEASVGYNKEIIVYESLVIQQPLQRIAEARKSFDENKILISAIKRRNMDKTVKQLKSVVKELISYKFTLIHSALLVEKYLYNLNAHTKISKLNHAVKLTSEKLVKSFESYVNLFSRCRDIFVKIWDNVIYVYYLNCQCSVKSVDTPFLLAFLVKLYDHYENTTGPERASMDRYFLHETHISSSLLEKLASGKINSEECKVDYTRIFPSFVDLYNVSLQKVQLTINNMNSFLETTRLDGTFFRYFPVLLCTPLHFAHHNTTITVSLIINVE